MESGTNRLFLDASYAIALANSRDQYHEAALDLADKHESTPFLTTQAVLLEIGNALSGRGHRKVAAAYVDAVQTEPATQVVTVTMDLFGRGLDLFRKRPDKTWGLTDCISFVVMRDFEIREALTADRHFEQAGFRCLLG
jgi:predicted nucleic acid-binding protein